MAEFDVTLEEVQPFVEDIQITYWDVYITDPVVGVVFQNSGYHTRADAENAADAWLDKRLTKTDKLGKRVYGYDPTTKTKTTKLDKPSEKS